jgi:hypothetical protein
LNGEISLPPLTEQRQIVARIEALAAKINEARRLRQKSIEECGRLLVCMAHRNDLVEAEKTQQGWRRVRLADVMEEVDDSHPVPSRRIQRTAVASPIQTHLDFALICGRQIDKALGGEDSSQTRCSVRTMRSIARTLLESSLGWRENGERI